MGGLGDKNRALLPYARRHDVARHGIHAPGLDVEPLEIHDRCGLGGALVHVGRAGEVGDELKAIAARLDSERSVDRPEQGLRLDGIDADLEVCYLPLRAFEVNVDAFRHVGESCAGKQANEFEWRCDNILVYTLVTHRSYE